MALLHLPHKYWMRIEELNLDQAGINYHSTLNPKVWDNDELKDEVHLGLVRIAEKFISFLNLESLKVQDIVLTGSMANFNWTRYSDFDLHIITDYSALTCTDLANELFRAKKDLWNSEHDITIAGYDVELYVEDSNDPPVSQGVYSLIKNKWLKQPEHEPPKFNDAAVDAKASGLMVDIDRIIKTESDDITEYEKLFEKIRKMRQAGLDRAGEFSTENLAFKILRNLGYLKKLKDTKHNILDKDLSIP
jgi:predicted nucleotidyltransferase